MLIDRAFRMITFIGDTLKKASMVLGESFASFRRNNDLALASSLAFSAMLALIPALFLLTSLLGMAIGSSSEAFREVQELVGRFIPSYSQEVLKEVRYIAAHKRTFGALNFLVFLLAVTPLVSDMRSSLAAIFRVRPGRPFLLEKLLDVAITVVFLLGVTAVALAGVVITMTRQWAGLPPVPGCLSTLTQFLFTAAAAGLLYFAFARKFRLTSLAAGALASAGLWFIMRPLFHQFLAYNPGYGLAFGSFKSLFVVIIWIYYSLVVFLAGAEIAAGLERRERTYFKRLMAGKGGLPPAVAERFLVRCEPGEVIFDEGGPGDRLFSVLKGSVSIGKGGREFTRVQAGQYFGVVSFLLDTPRIAAATAVDDVELVVITRRNITDLIHESPELILMMMKEIALRLRETNRLFE